MDRTVENIFTALIEICGTILAQEGISVESYAQVLSKCAQRLGFSEEEQLTATATVSFSPVCIEGGAQVILSDTLSYDKRAQFIEHLDVSVKFSGVVNKK